MRSSDLTSAPKTGFLSLAVSRNSSHRPWEIRIRSATGLIIGLFATMHLANHALGLISMEAQETARPWIMAVWHILPGQVLLYGSLITHAALGLHVLWHRRNLRMPPWQIVQLLMGIAIPYLLLVHITNTRVTLLLTGHAITYEYELASLWLDPWNRGKQILLVLLVWGHFVAGLHFWLRINARYRRLFPYAVAFYVLLPFASLLGFAEAARPLVTFAKEHPDWLPQLKARGVPPSPEGKKLKANGRELAPQIWLGLVALVFLGAQFRNWLARRRRFSVWYVKGALVSAPVGMSILEVSRMAHLPHQAACGGRGRCTTCRIHVLGTDGALPPPNAVEAEALARMHAPRSLRLACQLRPEVSIRVNPLVPAGSAAHMQHHPHGQELGEEREVTILFVDVRGSTKLAERRLPYDVVFLLSHFFAEMSAAVEVAGGHYSNFTGDGLMAIFGLHPAQNARARGALYCAWDMLERLRHLNDRLAEELEEPIAIGIGIHTGEAIVGRMGPPKTPVITALGDTVNTAARLENMTKEFQMPVVASLATLKAAGVSTDVEQREVLLRGRSTELPVICLDLDSLALCLMEKPRSDSVIGDLLAPGQAGPHSEA